MALLFSFGFGNLNCSSSTVIHTTPADAGAPKDAARDASPSRDAAPLPVSGGRLSATLYGSPPRFSAAAAFWDDRTTGPCSVMTFSDAPSCAVRRCSSGGEVTRSAGEIRITDARGVAEAMSPGVDAYYASVFAEPSPFRAGDALTYRASGGSIPPFETVLTVPPPLEVLSPLSPTVTVRLQAGLSSSWTPRPGTVRVEVSEPFVPGLKDIQGGITAECLFDAMAGHGEIPAAMLVDFVPTAAAATATVLVLAVAATTVDRGDSVVEVLANAGGVVAPAILSSSP